MTNTTNDLLAAHDRAVALGVREDNPLAFAPYSSLPEDAETVELSDPRLARIDRLRLLGDSDGWAYPFLDLSYCWGTLKDGSHVRVNLPRFRFPKKGLKGALIAMAKEEGVFAKGLGLLDDEVISRLR